MKNISFILVVLLLISSRDIYSDDLKGESPKSKGLSREEERLYYCSRYNNEPMMNMGKDELRRILSDTIDSTKEFDPDEHKGENIREAKINILKMHSKRHDTKMSILCTDKISDEDKLDLIMEDFYNVCKFNPKRPYVNVHYVNLMRLNIDDKKILSRVFGELNGKRAENECFNKSMILMLSFFKYDSREIGDKLINIFDKDKYNSFRLAALEAFIQGYSDYYTKEEMMPYIKKLMNEPYFSICKECDVVPKGCNHVKSYPFRGTLIRLLKKYKIKFEYIQLDECMIGGVPVLTE